MRHLSVFKHPGDGKEAGFSISDQFPKVISGYVMFQIQRKLVEEAPACTRGSGVLSSACAGKVLLGAANGLGASCICIHFIISL